ncbi:hypothetical protein EYF80_064745 [Liparis tanakae]|uniref:Uncharacterized protein n=1 Tax=Liparis tanakae TaxID=230148 RepID=A0A4Z2E8J7_9TELE|nr:hypothetical protein EYF80_064745 [Liparis tanakae]
MSARRQLQVRRVERLCPVRVRATGGNERGALMRHGVRSNRSGVPSDVSAVGHDWISCWCLSGSDPPGET